MNEWTVKAVLLGIVLAIVLGAANVYLGLYAGMTVSASIPAAVISMGILKGLLRRGTILENNMVQTVASAGESLAAGVVFTVPALVIAGAWTGFNYWQTTLMAAFGGVLGVVFMIPLRRPLIVEDPELKFPEGVACAEVLEAGDTGGSGIWYVFSALGLGAVFKFFVSAYSVVKATAEAAWMVGRAPFYMGADMSPALVGVGYIVGPNIAALVFLGGAISWVVSLPILGAVTGVSAPDGLVDALNDMWSDQIRYMGIGAMVVGGIASIVKVRHGIVRGVRATVLGVRAAGATEERPRTDQDLGAKYLAIAGLAAVVPTFFLYGYLIGDAGDAVVAGVVMMITAFFFVAVSSYIVGLVGSSNNPVSGMTICTVLFASALLLLLGVRGTDGIAASLGVAGVVCCAVCMAGDVSQDLKTGYLVGATPRRQQVGEIIGAVVPAFMIAPILTVLHRAYGIGSPAREGVEALRAPQATLFASISQGIFSGGAMPWNMVLIGVGVGLVLLVIDGVLQRANSRFRAHVMPVAVGVYLPLSLSVSILLGGLMSVVVCRGLRRCGESRVTTAYQNGVLFGSGLIAGEAITGILIAVLIVAGLDLPKVIVESTWLSLALFCVVVAGMGYAAWRKRED
ncbi:MAG: oligopeptide transporter, OPT family [Candidatus Eisenbacteria bacterium]|nr:oligopeptide transporter, OPT family [Candidatus Eisenbacteria bacterium]